MSRAGPQLKAFLLPAEASIEDDHLEASYDARHAFHFSQLQRREREFYDLLEDAGGGHLSVRILGPGGRLERGPVAGARTASDAVPKASGSGVPPAAPVTSAGEPKKA